MLYSSALVTRKTRKSPWHIHTSTFQLASHCFTLSRYPILIDLNALLPTLSSIFRSFPPHADIMHNMMGLWYTMKWCCCCGFHTSAAHQNKHTYKHRIHYLFTLFCFSVIPPSVIHLLMSFKNIFPFFTKERYCADTSPIHHNINGYNFDLRREISAVLGLTPSYHCSYCLSTVNRFSVCNTCW